MEVVNESGGTDSEGDVYVTTALIEDVAERMSASRELERPGLRIGMKTQRGATHNRRRCSRS